jgi:hypothetical protein
LYFTTKYSLSSSTNLLKIVFFASSFTISGGAGVVVGSILSTSGIISSGSIIGDEIGCAGRTGRIGNKST